MLQQIIYTSTVSNVGRSDVVEDSAVAELVARSPTHGTFKLKWTADIGHGQDKVLKCKVKFHDGQVSADGSGVHVSPFASTGNGQGVFRVSYLSSSGGWTAVARINFDATNGRVINAVDEGVEESGQTRASHLDVTFGSGIL
jgi:hypothetical protein